MVRGLERSPLLKIKKAFVATLIGCFFFAPFPLVLLWLLPSPIHYIVAGTLLAVWLFIIVFYATFARRFAIAAGVVAVVIAIVLLTITAFLALLGRSVTVPPETVGPTAGIAWAALYGLIVLTYVIWLGTSLYWVSRTADTEDYTWGGVTRAYALGRYAELGGITLYEQDKRLQEMTAEDDEPFDQKETLFGNSEDEGE